MNEPKTIVEYGQRCLLCRNDAAASRVLCWKHIDEMRDMLDPDNTGLPLDDLPPSIPVMFAALDACPGGTGLGERRAPGFASMPPGSLHIMAMRDPRSCAHPVATTTLPSGEVVDEWYSAGADGWPDFSRPHYEDDSAVRAVEKCLQGLADALHDEHRDDLWPPLVGVDAICVWLHDRVTALSRLAWADDAYRDLRDLREQLRRATGDPPPKSLGDCTNDIVLDRETGATGPCGHALYPPPGKPTARDEPVKDVPIVVCGRCHAGYDGLAQLRLRIAELKGAS